MQVFRVIYASNNSSISQKISCFFEVADGGVWCLLDNYVSGGISHVAMQLDVQRKSATD